MTPDERQLLTGLFDRVRTAANTPRDRDAETLIADAVRVQPYAPYLLAQTVIVQEQTLTAAAARVEQLEARVRELESAAPSTPAASSFLGGIGKSIFGGGEPARPAPAPVTPSPWNRAGAAPQAQGFPGAAPAYAPQSQQPQAWQQPQAAPAAGGSFLKSALGTAAGVAGGVMLANSLGNMFGGHQQHNAFGQGGDNNQANFGGGSGSGGSLLDDRSQSGADHYGSSQQQAMAETQHIDDGLPAADNASYEDSGSSGGDDSSDV